jgi:hypothetical protein
MCSRKSWQKARLALLQKPFSQLTWQEKLEVEGIRRRHAARQKGEAVSDDGDRKPPTPYNTTEVRAKSSAVALYNQTPGLTHNTLFSSSLCCCRTL